MNDLTLTDLEFVECFILPATVPIQFSNEEPDEHERYESTNNRLLLWAIFWAVICLLAGIRLGTTPEGINQWVPFIALMAFTVAGAIHSIRNAWRR